MRVTLFKLIDIRVGSCEGGAREEKSRGLIPSKNYQCCTPLWLRERRAAPLLAPTPGGGKVDQLQQPRVVHPSRYPQAPRLSSSYDTEVRKPSKPIGGSVALGRGRWLSLWRFCRVPSRTLAVRSPTNFPSLVLVQRARARQRNRWDLTESVTHRSSMRH